MIAPNSIIIFSVLNVGKSLVIMTKCRFLYFFLKISYSFHKEKHDHFDFKKDAISMRKI